MPSPVVEVDPYLELMRRFRELHERIEQHMAETDRRLEVLFASQLAPRRFRVLADGPDQPDVVVYREDGQTVRWSGTLEEVGRQMRAEFYR